MKQSSSVDLPRGKQLSSLQMQGQQNDSTEAENPGRSQGIAHAEAVRQVPEYAEKEERNTQIRWGMT